MTPARVAVLGLLAVAVIAVAVVALRGDGGPTYTLEFANAGQLVTGNDVQISGRPVGSIKEIRLSDRGQAEIEIQITDSSLDGLPAGTKAAIRQPSLSSVAGRFISLQLGTGPKLESGETIPASATQSTVDLDQLFNTFDEPTRKGLQQFVQGSATWYAGKGPEANEAAKYLAPALSSTSRLLREITSDQDTFESLIVSTAKVVGALAERKDDLSGLVRNANATGEALASQSAALDDALGELPTTLRRGNSTFVNLRATLDDLEPLVDVSLDQTKDLEPFLRELRPVLQEAGPTVRDLSKIVNTPGADNDLTDLLTRAPQLSKAGTKAFASTKQAIDDSLPLLTFARPYAPELIGLFRDFGQANAYYDAAGHFARLSAVTNAFSYDQATNVLTPQDPSQRLNGVQTGNIKRCPGAATQPAADGSSPFNDGGKLDCDTTKVLPGG